MTALDHGILNIPLAKRGNINAEIDRFKANEAIARKAALRVRHQTRVNARELLTAAPDASLVSLAGKLSMTVKQTRDYLRAQCISQPLLVIKFLGEVR